MDKIKKFQVDGFKAGCRKTFDDLSGDFQQICKDTGNWYDDWLKERQYRITGSTCYNLFTYSKNKKEDWKKKCDDTFSQKTFKSAFTEYGKNTEEEARDAFIKVIQKTVFKTGLIVSKQNPWLGYSPNGLIFKENTPETLLKIKCPYIGKTAGIKETINSKINKYLIMDGENMTLIEKHPYYGQIQLGMAVLNVKVTYFVIYASFDKNLLTLKMIINEAFVIKMLTELKKVYFDIMLHSICLRKNVCDKDAKDVSENRITCMQSVTFVI